jgi:chitin synthase
MFMQFIQYLLMTPTYINILNVYAFCNTHDITWGTKGDDKPDKLPSVTTKADGKADISAPTDDADLNTQYETELRVFSTKYIEPKKVPSAQDKQEDYYKGFRSAVVLAWMFCNLALCAVVLQTGGLQVTAKTGSEDADERRKATIYLAVVLWSVAGLSAFRFIGAMWFLIVRMVSLMIPQLPYGLYYSLGNYFANFCAVPRCLASLQSNRTLRVIRTSSGWSEVSVS